MNLILLTDHDRRSDSEFVLTGYRATHITTVLRSAPGDTVEVGLIDGPTGTAEVLSANAEQVNLRCDRWHTSPEPKPAIDLICALPRPQTVKKILFTAGMCAVRSVLFIRANRVEKSFFHSPLLADSGMLPYLLEGMSQGKQTRRPKITIHDRFRPFVETELPALLGTTDSPLKIIPTPESTDTLAGCYTPRPEHLVAAIGPEGGWVDFELEQFASVGFTPISLGRWVLRVEHAVTTLLGQIELLNFEHENR